MSGRLNINDVSGLQLPHPLCVCEASLTFPVDLLDNSHVSPK